MDLQKEIADYIEEKRNYNEFVKLVGVEFTAFEEGYARAELEIQDKHKNYAGSVHGGCLYTLADTVTATAMATYGYRGTTLSGSMNYLRPAIGAKRLIAEARVVRHGRKITVIDVTIMSEQQKLFANGSFTYYNLGTPIWEKRQSGNMDPGKAQEPG